MQLSEELGLSHVSRGEGNERCIVVSKVKGRESTGVIVEDTRTHQTTGASCNLDKTSASEKMVATKSVDKKTSTGAALSSLAELNNDSGNEGNRREGGSQEAATAGVWQCDICGIRLPETNRELHQLRCEREKRKVEDIVKEKKKESERKQKETQKKSKPKAAASTKQIELDDLDLLLEEMKKADKTCNFSSCKKSVNHLGITCPFCRKKYCMTHNTAETHGCEETARRMARQELEKELRGEGTRGGKKHDATKRAHLQRKLDKRISDLSGERQRKKPSSS